jgi:hypothetical protein
MVTTSPPILNAHLIGKGFQASLPGMDLLREYHLGLGTMLYRFVQVTPGRPATMGADGPWWLEHGQFITLTHFALAHGMRLSAATLLFAATASEWSEVNGFVRAEVIQPLKCWKGRGKRVERPAKKTRGRVRAAPTAVGQDVYQLYIPGIGGISSLFPTAFSFLDFTSIQAARRP